MKKTFVLIVLTGMGLLLGAADMSAWQTPRRGVMVSENISAEDLAVLNDWNVNLVRWQLRWKDHPKSPADHATAAEYDAWLESALEHFDEMLPLLRQYGIKVVLDLHTAPGGRRESDAVCTVFLKPEFQKQLVDVWTKIATRYRNNPDIIAYDIMNEPVIPDNFPAGIKPWREQASDVIRAIRRIDPGMPIVFENHQWAIPNTMTNLQPLPFRNIIYSIHFYYPYEIAFQGLNGSPNGIPYPGPAGGVEWNRDRLEQELKPVIDFQKQNNCLIYIGEFSCIRWAPGETRANLLRDMISIFEAHNWPWTYHAFREWSGWSVEHNNDSNDPNPSATQTTSEKLLRSYFDTNKK